MRNVFRNNSEKIRDLGLAKFQSRDYNSDIQATQQTTERKPMITFQVYNKATRNYLGFVKAKSFDQAELAASLLYGVPVYLRMCM
jgi:hypothetical protein